MQNAKQVLDAQATQYATRADFAVIFDHDMNSLHLLSLLLTADRQKAEKCFVAGLEDSVETNWVFKEWARSWARRAIIQNAARMINPRPGAENKGSNIDSFNTGRSVLAERPELAAVLELAPFERFVFVMSVLERYTDQDCSLLLGASRRDVLAARARALKQIAKVDLRRTQQSNARSEAPALPADHGAGLHVQMSEGSAWTA